MKASHILAALVVVAERIYLNDTAPAFGEIDVLRSFLLLLSEK
jgi:hypothetical protein